MRSLSQRSCVYRRRLRRAVERLANANRDLMHGRLSRTIRLDDLMREVGERQEKYYEIKNKLYHRYGWPAIKAREQAEDMPRYLAEASHEVD